QYDQRSRDFFQSDSGTHTLRYEDLVRYPEQGLRGIREFLHEAFEPNLRDTREAAKAGDSYRRPWLAKVHDRIDEQRAEAWRDELSDSDVALADALLGDRLREFAYAEDAGSDREYAKLYPEEMVRSSVGVIQDLASR